MKRVIKRILTYVFGLVCAAYLLMAFTVFNKPDGSNNVCEAIRIDIADESSNGFITKSEVEERLKNNHLYPIGQQMKDVDIRNMEEMLASSPFVETAECYKSQDNSVNISITQRLPIIRVKAANGDDYYVDDKDSIMPNMQYTSDLIIATGHISRSYATNYLAPLGKALMSNELWRDLVEQINVLNDLDIEMIPRVGSHVVKLGPLPVVSDKKERKKVIEAFVDKKLTRLMKFYRYGLSDAGWNKYSCINVAFDNQIVCTRRDTEKKPVVPVVEVKKDSLAAPATTETPATAGTPTPQPQTKVHTN